MKGLSYLIEHINNASSDYQGISNKEFIEYMRVGVLTEPEKIKDLIFAYKNVLDKFRDDLSSDIRFKRSLRNIAYYAVLADHDYQDDKFINLYLEGNNFLDYYLENVKEYGNVTNALSVYLNLSGKELKEFILNDNKKDK
jgi:hypothetical protein